MSKITFEPNASGTGVFTIASPNSSTDYTINLPEINGGTLVSTDASGNVGIGTASPASILEVSSASPIIIIEDDNAATQATTFGLIQAQTVGGIAAWDIGTRANDEFRLAVRDATGVMTFHTDSTERVRIDSSGFLLVGATSTANITGGATEGCYLAPGSFSAFSRTSTGTRRQIGFYNPNGLVGEVSTTGLSTSYVTSSDYRLKENVITLDNATDRLKQIPVYRFNFIADADVVVDGFLAHEVQAIVPEAITGTKDEVDDEGNPVYQGIDQSKLVPLLVATVKELEARIAALEAN